MSDRTKRLDNHRGHRNSTLRRNRSLATYRISLTTRYAMVCAPRPYGISSRPFADFGRDLGFPQGIALARANGGGDSAPESPRGTSGERTFTIRERPTPSLSDNRFIRKAQRWVYRVAYGENPEETNYLRDFPLESDVFPIYPTRRSNP